MKQIYWAVFYVVFFLGCDSDYNAPLPQEVPPASVTPQNTEDPVYEWEWEYPRGPNFLEDIEMRFYRPLDQAMRISVGQTTLETERKPWSSWWYPFKSEELILASKKSSSPLLKYDRWHQERYGQPSNAFNFHRENRYDPDSVAWAGLCTARAFASALHAEPQKSGRIGKTCFHASDLTALLVHTYEGVTPEQWQGWYGQRNDNRPNQLYSDIYPDQFHHILMDEIGVRANPVLMDHAAGVQVWTDVIYKVMLNVSKSVEEENAVDVEAKVFYPRFSLSKKEREVAKWQALNTLPQIRVYNYRLYGSWEGAELLVTRGRWMKGSILDHPDYLMLLPDESTGLNNLRRSHNSEVSTRAVDELLNEVRLAPPCERRDETS